jgi:hypothetical protein
MPTIESMLEIMIDKMDPKARTVLNTAPLCLIQDLQQYMSGQTISYSELVQGMISSKTINRDIYESLVVTKAPSFDALKEIALEQAPQSLLNATQIKKVKAKKSKK